MELTLQGVAVKIARTDVDAKAFVDEFVAVLRERVSRATSNSEAVSEHSHRVVQNTSDRTSITVTLIGFMFNGEPVCELVWHFETALQIYQ